MEEITGEVCKIYYNEAEISNDRMKRLPFVKYAGNNSGYQMNG